MTVQHSITTQVTYLAGGQASTSTDQVTKTGTTELLVSDTVPATGTQNYEIAINPANLKSIYVTSNRSIVEVRTNVPETIMAQGAGNFIWHDSMSAASPITQAATSIDVQNFDATDSADVVIRILLDDPP